MIRTILFLLTSTLLISCNTKPEGQNNEEQLAELISGDWERVLEKDKSSDDFPPPPSYGIPEGMTITKDSIEFYEGFIKDDWDSITGKRTRLYLGTWVPSKTINDSIFIKNPLTTNWEFKWKFIRRNNDTLELTLNDLTLVKYKQLHYNLDTLADFDQIIFSSSGCYGSCPILDISIDKSGNVLFHGEGYVSSLGFYTAQLDKNLSISIFNKFRRANPLRLSDEYDIGHTDDQTLTTSFIQNGKIVKTIYDYGMAGTKELKWAYIPQANIHNTYQLDSLPTNESFYPNLHDFTFKKDTLILPLEKSESFYLWTELKKAKQTLDQFQSIYEVIFRNNYPTWGLQPSERTKDKSEIKSITTDGQLFKFEFQGEESITYDLGYNFVDRNFKITDFRKPYGWEPQEKK